MKRSSEMELSAKRLSIISRDKYQEKVFLDSIYQMLKTKFRPMPVHIYQPVLNMEEEYCWVYPLFIRFSIVD